MGAHNFEIEARGKTAKEAFDTAVADAVFENGHNSYNGTISTCFDFIMVPFDDVGDEEDLYDWQGRVIELSEVTKRGSCGCVQDRDDPKLWHFAGWAAS